ncbi:MAG: hypothetical protein V4568_03365 [Pseudomonadota bacterium]
MTQQELGKAKDQDLPASLTAMRRAARMARELAVRTGTSIVVMQGDKVVRISTEEIRKQGGA